MFLLNCGTVSKERPGLCAPYEGGGNNTASLSDPDGKPWTIDASSGADSKCAEKGQVFSFAISAVIKDSLKVGKGGLSVRVNLGGGFTLAKVDQDKVVPATFADFANVTDICGGASYLVIITCPGETQTQSGTFQFQSGPLASETKTINLVHEKKSAEPAPPRLNLFENPYFQLPKLSDTK